MKSGKQLMAPSLLFHRQIDFMIGYVQGLTYLKVKWQGLSVSLGTPSEQNSSPASEPPIISLLK